MSAFVDLANKYLSQRPIPVSELNAAIGKAGQDAREEDFESMVSIALMDDSYDELISLPALVMLPFWGTKGIDQIIIRAFDKRRKSAALAVLACLAQGIRPQSTFIPFLRSEIDQYVTYKITEEVKDYINASVKKKILLIFEDEVDKAMFFHSIATSGLFSAQYENKIAGYYYNLLIDSYLLINDHIIAEFQELLNKKEIKEEELQVFLTDNPILLDPFTIEIRTKHQLGDDFITDYVSRRVNDEYLIIEIETTTDKLFNRDGQFSSALTKAVSQVRDFQAWIADNISYAQQKLPGIRRPEGLVVIGRDKDLDSLSKKRLSEENFSRRGHIKIVTYDDLLNQGKIVHSNIIKKPIVLRARDQKTI